MTSIKPTPSTLFLTECPRDAMQGLEHFIPTSLKARYINQLLRIGFDSIDFGSFVSPKAIPQLKDTAEVLGKLQLNYTSSKLLAIIANKRGAEDACHFDEITYLGFPLSLSETFQQRNTNKSIKEAFAVVEEIQTLATQHKKQQVVYLSMGFGNPYGDPYTDEYIVQFVQQLQQLGITRIAPSDTVGVATPESIRSLFSTLIKEFPNIEFGAHLHSNPNTAKEKIEAAYQAGCRRFDTAIKGFGGCPMAKDELVGNVATEQLIETVETLEVNTNLNKEEFNKALILANEVFLSPH